MELDTEDPSPRDGRDEPTAIRRRREHVLLVVADQVIAVDEIEIVARGDAGEERRGAREGHLVPADVRDALILAYRLEAPHLALDPPETVGDAALVAARAEPLPAQADAQERDAPDHGVLPQDLVEAPRAEVADAVAEGADARQDDVRRGLDLRGAVGHDRAAAAFLDRPPHRVEVSHPVVDHRHALHRLS